MNSSAAAKPSDPVESGQKEKFPPQIAFIVGNEACERFSFYGLTSILTLYLKNHMLHDLPADAAAAKATEIVHLFNMAIYFLPLFGGWLADRWLGRYRTILFISLFYCLGHGTLALYGNTLYGVYAGLGLIAIGAGGIKPSVAAFVGDQFGGRQGKWLTRVYGWFYWAVNFGALFAFTMIPALRDWGKTRWSEEAAYRVAFGVPGIFMGLATIVFWLGTKYYVRVPPGHQQKEPGFLEVIWYALVNQSSRRRFSGPAREHSGTTPPVLTSRYRLSSFFDPVRERFGEEAVTAAKSVLRILVVFASVPVFWAIYFQVNTTWVIQADKMVPSNLFGFFKVDAERMQSAGALLVLVWVPIMTFWLYPLAEKLGLRPTPLRRMALGMVLTGIASGICGLIQVNIDHGQTVGIAWQIVPYIVLEAGEVLVSATALEFAFGQAPATMKSTIMSFWFLTSSLGNFLVVVVTALNEKYVKAQGAAEFGFYAVLMLVAAGIFMLCTRIYRGRETPPAAMSTA